MINNKEHFETRKLKEVCNVVSGYAFKSSDFIDKGIPVIKISNIGYSDFVWKSQQYLNQTFLESCKDYRIFPGDLLIALTRPITNNTTKVCKYPANAEVGLLNQRVACIKENTVEKDFLFWYFQTQKFKTYIKSKLSETLQPNLSPKELELTPIPFYSQTQQRKIVSKIEELFSELEKGIENLRLAQQQLKTYRQSVLKWAFEGKLTNENVDEGELPNGWRKVSITDLADKSKNALKAGPFGSSLKKEFYVEKGYKIYGQEQVISGDAFFGNYYINEEKYQELSSCKIKPFDILISLVGTVGKVLLLPENCQPGIINPRLIKISLDRNVYLPKFFKYYFESSFVKSYYGAETRGTTMDVLNLGIIKTIPFPLCSIEEQNKIIQEIDSRISVADKMEESINQSLQQADALRQSILKKAFEGKLI